MHDLLRVRWGYEGAIFSDDLGRAGAFVAGSPADRAHAAIYAGCDMVRICNDFAAMDEILQTLEGRSLSGDSARRIEHMRAHPTSVDAEHLEAARSRLLALHDYGETPLI